MIRNWCAGGYSLRAKYYQKQFRKLQFRRVFLSPAYTEPGQIHKNANIDWYSWVWISVLAWDNTHIWHNIGFSFRFRLAYCWSVQDAHTECDFSHAFAPMLNWNWIPPCTQHTHKDTKITKQKTKKPSPMILNNPTEIFTRRIPIHTNSARHSSHIAHH